MKKIDKNIVSTETCNTTNADIENIDKSKTYGRVYSSFKDENGDIVVICQIVLIKKFRL